jgi:hypothetical protein
MIVPTDMKRKQTWVIMSICVVAGLEALAFLISSMADELDPVGELAQFASKVGLVVLAVILVGAYFFRRRYLAVTRTKSRRRRHRRRYYKDETIFAETHQAHEKSASGSGADL